MLAESGEEGSAVMGVHRKGTHQLACILTDLREWIEGWMLFFCSRLALCALLAPVVAPQHATTAGAEVLEQYGTRHSPPNTHQVREQSAAHALHARRTEERVSLPRQGDGGASSLRPLLRCCASRT